MAKLKAALALGAVAAMGVGTYSYLSCDEDAAGTRNLANQVWIERMPQNHQDMIGHIVMLDKEFHIAWHKLFAGLHFQARGTSDSGKSQF